MSRRAAGLGWGLLAATLVLGVIWGRVFTSAREELALGRAAEQAGLRDVAVERYQYAMRWYAPLATAPVEAADALERLASEAESAGDRAFALTALRRLRGGIMATRSFYSPFGARRADVDERLALLSAEEQKAQGLDRGQDLESLRAEHRRLLALDPTPHTAWALAATLGFAGWIGGAFGFLFRGLDARLRLVHPAAARWAAFAAASFVTWMLGLWLA